MPAMLDDPASPTIHRTSGVSPYPNPHDPNPSLPADLFPRQVILRDRVTTATLVPFSSQHQVPHSLLVYLCEQLNREIEMGDTYPMIELMTVEKFASYWFQNFGAIMLLGSIESASAVTEGRDWTVDCLGSYYIKPNYPGRSSHVCNAGFLVTSAARNKGVGRLMGESYIDWAPRLGYTYSVFNLVYETNVASCRIWDALGFKRIGRVKGAGNLKSYPGQLVDAIIYGRDLGPDGSDFVSEERFDKIKFYLKHNKYPAGADRAEKSRLRSAATHYKLILAEDGEDGEDKLMLKDKEVISDPQKQYQIARNVHVVQHGGINKTTATIAEKYHWVRIKETVSLVIRNCGQCKELGKTPVVKADGVIRPPAPKPTIPAVGQQSTNPAVGRVLSLAHQTSNPHHPNFPVPAGQGSVSPQVLNRTLPNSSSQHDQPQHAEHIASPSPSPRLQHAYMPLDPQIMEDVRNHLGGYNQASTTPDHHHHHHHHHHEEEHFDEHDPAFQIMMTGRGQSHEGGKEGEGEVDADGEEDGDLDMLIDDDDDGGGNGEEPDETSIQLQAEAAARAADRALQTVGKEYPRG